MTARGFTLLEVLFALSLTAMLALAIGGSVVLSLRTEARSQLLQTQTMDVTTLQTRLLVSPSEPTLPNGWREVGEGRAAAGETTRSWVIYAHTDAAAGQRLAFSFTPTVDATQAYPE